MGKIAGATPWGGLAYHRSGDHRIRCGQPWYVALLSPARIALLGTAVVVLVLLLPIRVPAPGNHEDSPCGNAFVLDIGRPQDYELARYWTRTYELCTSQRISRLAQSIGVLAVTLLATTLAVARGRRRDEQAMRRESGELGGEVPGGHDSNAPGHG